MLLKCGGPLGCPISPYGPGTEEEAVDWPPEYDAEYVCCLFVGNLPPAAGVGL